MNDDDWLIVGIIAIALLAVLGIVVGFTNSIESILMSVGASTQTADRIGSFLFFGILLVIVIGGGSRLMR